MPTVGVPIFGRRSYRFWSTNTEPPLTAQFSKTSTLIITAGPQRRWDLYFFIANSACFALRPFLKKRPFGIIDMVVLVYFVPVSIHVPRALSKKCPDSKCGVLLELVPPTARAFPTVQFANRGGPYQCPTHCKSSATCSLALDGQDSTPHRSSSPPLAKEVKVSCGHTRRSLRVQPTKSSLGEGGESVTWTRLLVSLPTQNYTEGSPPLVREVRSAIGTLCRV